MNNFLQQSQRIYFPNRRRRANVIIVQGLDSNFIDELDSNFNSVYQPLEPIQLENLSFDEDCYINEINKDASWRKLADKLKEIIEENKSPLCAAYKNLLKDTKPIYNNTNTEPFRNILHWLIWQFSKSKLFTRAASRSVTDIIIIMFETLKSEGWFKH